MGNPRTLIARKGLSLLSVLSPMPLCGLPQGVHEPSSEFWTMCCGWMKSDWNAEFFFSGRTVFQKTFLTFAAVF